MLRILRSIVKGLGVVCGVVFIHFILGLTLGVYNFATIRSSYGLSLNPMWNLVFMWVVILSYKMYKKTYFSTHKIETFKKLLNLPKKVYNWTKSFTKKLSKEHSVFQRALISAVLLMIVFIPAIIDEFEGYEPTIVSFVFLIPALIFIFYLFPKE